MAHQDPTWTVIPDFTGHQVNSSGQIRNIASGKVMRTSINQTGVRYVSMFNTTERRYQNMAVSVVVASTFCPGRSANTNTVMHLNGDHEDMRAENLMWVTRFHAIQFHRELSRVNDARGRENQIVDENGKVYGNALDAAKATGCLPSAIRYAVTYNDNMGKDEHMNFVQKVWPGARVFRSVD
jgi:hypothetical protein